MIGLPDEWIEAVRQDDSNTQRLVLSDWLEEQGERDKALFIRAQVLIAQHGARCKESDFLTHQVTTAPGARLTKGGYCRCPVCQARIKEWEAFRERKKQWFGDFACNLLNDMDRGFVKRLEVSGYNFGRLDLLAIALNPLVRVTMTNKSPKESSRGFRWSILRPSTRMHWSAYFRPHCLPIELRGYVTERFFKTAQDAMDHASEGVLRYMRDRAKISLPDFADFILESK